MCRESLEEEQIGHGPWYKRGEEPWPGVVTGVMARFVRRAPRVLEAAEVGGCRVDGWCWIGEVCADLLPTFPSVGGCLMLDRRGVCCLTDVPSFHVKRNQDEALLASLLRTCPYFEARANAAAMLGALSGLDSTAGAGAAAAAADVRATRVEAAGALLKGVLDAEAHVMVLAAVSAFRMLGVGRGGGGGLS